MKCGLSFYRTRKFVCLLFSLLFAFSPATQFVCLAQSSISQTESEAAQALTTAPLFRLERREVTGGAELLTIFGNLESLPRESGQDVEVPLISILRDTLGDSDPENDRLRYVWMLTYSKPAFKQKISAAVPFFYNRAGNKKQASSKDTPPPVIDLASTGKDVWEKIFLSSLQNIFLDQYSFPIKASTRSFGRNLSDYRRSHIMRALATLSLYDAVGEGKQVFTDEELSDIQARLMLSEKPFGGIVDEIYLERYVEKQSKLTNDIRGHNWELLRQRAEAESLYFEPLKMPDGTATHVLLWVAREDLARNADHGFERRFLNIASPWNDEKLLNWKGYSEVRYFDAEQRQVAQEAEGARAVEMIPLALYGLDHPKIPALLVDFRDQMNPKKREMSRRVLKDITRNIFAFSRFGDLPYFLGRTVYDFVTGRRGMDINQPSRLRAYSELKLLLSLDASLDPQLRKEIDERLEKVSLNPLENDLDVEANLAREQYRALLNYANNPKGLPEQLARDRRAEMVPLKHGRAAQVVFRLGNLASFGLYKHREAASAEMQAQIDVQRRLAYHVRFLREAVRSSPQIEVVRKLEDVQRSVRYINDHGDDADAKAAEVLARVFARTEDVETRRLCLSGLYEINNETAKSELLRIYRDPQVDDTWRTISAEYLRLAVRENKRVAPTDAKAISSMVGQ
ncbi:MAG: hypothetical protein WCB68_12135 [Pyrinomonadaceae bacterium]